MEISYLLSCQAANDDCNSKADLHFTGPGHIPLPWAVALGMCTYRWLKMLHRWLLELA
jgi:hypothetical protein